MPVEAQDDGAATVPAVVLAEREKALMSGGFGYYDGDNFDGDAYGDPSVQAPQQNRQQPNPLREHLKKVEDQNTELTKQVAQLLAQQRKSAVVEGLRAKGYDPAVASLYGGEPDKLDEWLTNVGPLLAKQPTVTTDQGAAGQQGQAPASTVPADGQSAMQQLQGMGTMAAPPQGTEAEQMAQMRAAQTPEALMEYLRSQGNPYYHNG